MSESSSGTDIARPDILDILRRDDPATALEDAHRTVTYRELRSRVHSTAVWLTGRGVRQGDRVAVSTPNSADCVELFLANAALGAIWVGIDPGAPPAERQRQLDAVGPRLVLAESDAAALREAASAEAVPDQLRPDADAPCAIAFTSGTTGTPKAIVHSRAGVSLVAASSAAATVRGDDWVGITLPLSILNVMIVGPLAALMAGATAAVVCCRNAGELASACRETGLSLVRALVPATIYDLVHDPGIAPDSLSSLRVVETGAAGLPDSLREEFEAKFGRRLIGSYGLSEAPAVVCCEDPSQPHRPGASGTPLPHLSISVRGDGGSAQPEGAEGEIWIGPATEGRWADIYRPALGTWSDGHLVPRKPGEPAFPTGDLGSIDTKGAVHISARKSDVIVRGGINVTATELQSVLAAIPGVRDVAVVGRADPRLGERIVAFVELDPAGDDLHADQPREHARNLLSRGKVPDDFVVMAALPRNAMGKVAKADLIAMAANDGRS